MKFRTVYERTRIFTNSGDIYEPTYKLKSDKNGVTDLKQVGKINCYEMIQSHADSVDLKLILEKFTNGDDSALNKVRGCYGDFTEMPKTFAELAQRVLDAEDLFNQLPVDVRAEFNHSPNEFFASIGTEKFNNAMSSTVAPVEDAPVNIAVEQKGVSDVQEQ